MTFTHRGWHDIAWRKRRRIVDAVRGRIATFARGTRASALTDEELEDVCRWALDAYLGGER
jgi:hypothetical protein